MQRNIRFFGSFLGGVFCASTASAFWGVQRQEQDRESGDGSEYNLKLVQVVFRHGARTPLTSRYWEGQQWDVCGKLIQYSPTIVQNVNGGSQPESKVNNKELNTKLPGGCHKGELTLVGQRQALELGLQLREKYIEKLKFLPYEYAENILQGRTTNYQRTMATLNGVITGLYPYTNGIPVRVQTAEDVDEILYVNTHKCERLRNILDHSYAQIKSNNTGDKSFFVASKQKPIKHDVNSTTTFLEADQETGSEEFLRTLAKDIISQRFEQKDKDEISFVGFYDAVTTLKFHSKQLPQNFLDLCSSKFQGGFDEFMELIEKWAIQKLLVAMSPTMEDEQHKDIMRLSMGLLLWQMVQKMEKIASGQQEQQQNNEGIDSKMYLYSGHDTTITPLLMALGCEVKNWPPYASNVVLELWEKKGQYYVTALFNGEIIVTTNGEDNGGGRRIEMIPLSDFKQDVIGAYVLTEEQHENECAVVFKHDQSMPESTPATHPQQSSIVDN